MIFQIPRKPKKKRNRKKKKKEWNKQQATYIYVLNNCIIWMHKNPSFFFFLFLVQQYDRHIHFIYLVFREKKRKSNKYVKRIGSQLSWPGQAGTGRQMGAMRPNTDYISSKIVVGIFFGWTRGSHIFRAVRFDSVCMPEIWPEECVNERTNVFFEFFWAKYFTRVQRVYETDQPSQGT